MRLNRTIDFRPFYVTVMALLVSGLFAGAAQAAGLTIEYPIKFKDGIHVRDATRNECELQTRVPDAVIRAMGGEGAAVTKDPKPDIKSKGRVLTMEITEVFEAGNYFTGRRKAVRVAGSLHENGKEIGSFTAYRDTMGGMWANYQGNCSFLGRCATTLGKDIAAWLAAPTMNASIP